MPVPLFADVVHDASMLGEHGVAFTSRGNTEIAFDLDTGQEKWRWTGKGSFIFPHMALRGGAVLLRDGGQYFALIDGKVVEQVDEDDMLFILKYRVADDQ
jgi:outer membrane protein assembly factor BamB